MTTTATTPPNDVSGQAVDRLYRGPLEEFTPVRNELAKKLRADGKTEAADWVKGLRKPTRAAWLASQVAAKNRRAMRQLLRASAGLRDAQDEMLAGSTDHRKLRENARRERLAIDSLNETAEKLGAEQGVGPQILAKVFDTLQAAAADSEVAAALESGRLDREQRAASLGIDASAAPPAKASAKAEDREAAGRRERRRLAKLRQEAERKLAKAEHRLGREREGLERARESLEEAERRVHAAELEANAAGRDLEGI